MSQNGAGALTLTNANSYSGGTSVNAGTLVVNSATGSATGTGPVVIVHNATLSGTGSISGAVTNSGIVAPGLGIGTLRTKHNYAQDSIGSLQIDLASGSSFDRLVVDGAAALRWYAKCASSERLFAPRRHSVHHSWLGKP